MRFSNNEYNVSLYSRAIYILMNINIDRVNSIAVTSTIIFESFSIVIQWSIIVTKFYKQVVLKVIFVENVSFKYVF